MEQKFYEKFTQKKNSKKEKTPKKTVVKRDENRTPSKSSDNAKDQKKSYKKSTELLSSSQFKITESLFKTDKLTAESISILNNFDEIIQGVRPLNSKQRLQLPDNIRSLSHQLTDQRSERRLGYMNDNVQLSSYVRYYTWWNLVRLTRLFSNLPDELFPTENAICLDLGSGPLTVVTALWLARPELRKLKLTWYCLDVSSNSMALGEDVFLSVAAKSSENEPWQIIRVKGSFGTTIKQKADFITCANMFNELDQAGDMPPEYQTKKYFEQLNKYSTQNASFLLVEPGVPKAARTLSLLRTRFINEGKKIAAPCPHAGECPMNGFSAYTGSKNKWCNFAFSTEDAPSRLQKLSEQAKLPKERATLSFLAVVTKNNSDDDSKVEHQNLSFGQTLCRVASDSFRLPGNFTGHYACTQLGLSLLRTKEENLLNSGDLLSVKIKTPNSLPKDEKSGACVISL